MLVSSAFLTVLLAAQTPLLSVRVEQQQARSVPPGAQRVEMLTVTLTASCARAVSVHGVTIVHTSMGDRRDITSLYAMSGDRRLSRGRQISSSDGTVVLTFPTSLTVPACEDRSLSILANFSATAAVAGEHALVLQYPSAIDAGDAVVVWAAGTSAASDGVRRTVGEVQGSVSVDILPLLTRVRYGDQRVVARLRITATGSRDQFLNGLTLTNGGSARDRDLQQLAVFMSRGVQVSRMLPSMDGRTATFFFDPPFLLRRGAVYLLEVHADVRVGARKTIGFTLEEPSDVRAQATHRRR